MTNIEIEYCVPCGFLGVALTAEKELLEEFGQDIDALTMQPSHGGVFKITVDGETVWDKETHGAELDLELITDAVRNQASAD